MPFLYAFSQLEGGIWHILVMWNKTWKSICSSRSQGTCCLNYGMDLKVFKILGFCSSCEQIKKHIGFANWPSTYAQDLYERMTTTNLVL